MIFYKVSKPRYEDQADGESNNSWHTSLEAARTAYQDAIRNIMLTPEEYVYPRVRLERYVTRDLTTKKLVLAILNDRRWAEVEELALWDGKTP